MYAVENAAPDFCIDDRQHGVILHWRLVYSNHAVENSCLTAAPSGMLAAQNRLAETLPGAGAQLKFWLTPARPGWRAGHFPPDTRTAAALLLLYPRDTDVAMPLTIRASGLPRHAGQISLPGRFRRRRNAEPDGTARGGGGHGVDANAGRILGELTPVHVVVSGFTLHLVIGVTDRRPDFAAAPGEVDQILEASLDDLRDASRIGKHTRIREGVAVEWPVC